MVPSAKPRAPLPRGTPHPRRDGARAPVPGTPPGTLRPGRRAPPLGTARPAGMPRPSRGCRGAPRPAPRRRDGRSRRGPPPPRDIAAAAGPRGCPAAPTPPGAPAPRGRRAESSRRSWPRDPGGRGSPAGRSPLSGPAAPETRRILADPDVLSRFQGATCSDSTCQCSRFPPGGPPGPRGRRSGGRGAVPGIFTRPEHGNSTGSPRRRARSGRVPHVTCQCSRFPPDGPSGPRGRQGGGRGAAPVTFTRCDHENARHRLDEATDRPCPDGVVGRDRGRAVGVDGSRRRARWQSLSRPHHTCSQSLRGPARGAIRVPGETCLWRGCTRVSPGSPAADFAPRRGPVTHATATCGAESPLRGVPGQGGRWETPPLGPLEWVWGGRGDWVRTRVCFIRSGPPRRPPSPGTLP